MTAKPTTHVRTHEWRGANGFLQLRHGRTLAVPRPGWFFARLRWLRTDDVDVAEWTSTPISGTLRFAVRDDDISIMTVLRGHGRYWSDTGGTAEVTAGSGHLVVGTEPLRFTSPEATVLLRISMSRGLVGDLASEIGALEASSTLLDVLISISEHVLDTDRADRPSPARRAIRPLALALVGGAAPRRSTRNLITLRERVLDHIERHLSDPGLTPQTIANDLGVSVRWVHQAFDGSNTTVARSIRERRLDRVAAALRNSDSILLTSALVEAAGFSSKEQLSRSFKARYGLTPRGYAEAVALRGEPLPRAGSTE